MINQNINNLELRQEKVPFKADSVPTPFPGMMIPSQTFAIPEAEDVQLPETYYMPANYKTPKTFKDSIKKIDLFGLITPWFEHPLLMLGACTGLSFFVDEFDKACNKEYEKSVVGRAAKLGDKIESSKMVQNDTSKKVLKGIKNGWTKVKNFALKNDVIYAMCKTPSEPEWSIPKDELKHTEYRIVTKFKELALRFNLKPEAGLEKLSIDQLFEIKDLALSRDEINELKKIYNVKRLSEAPEKEVVNRVMLKRLGKSEGEIKGILSKGDVSNIVTKEIWKKSGLTPADIEKIFKDETGKESIEIVKKASENLKDIKLAHGKIVIPGARQPFANVEGFGGVYNRIHSMTDGAATKTGRFMSKLVQKIYRGFTWGGAKLGVLIWVAPFLVETILNTKEADRKEKAGTAVSGLLRSFSWVFTFPIVHRAIYAFGGMQYAGMGKEKVEEYKNLVNKFNETAINNGFKDLAEYKKEKKILKGKLKDLRKVKGQNLLTETLRGIGKFSKADLLKIESFRGGTPQANFLRRLPNLMKDYLVYVPGRFIVFMFVGMNIADKLIDKCTSSLFGKPYDGMKERDIVEAQKKQEEFTINKLRERLLEIQRDKLNPQIVENNSEKIAGVKNGFSELVPVSMLKLAEKGATEENKPAISAQESENLNILPSEESVEEVLEDKEPDIAVDTSKIEAEESEKTANEELKSLQEEPNIEVIEPEKIANKELNFLNEEESKVNIDKSGVIADIEPEIAHPAVVSEVMPEEITDNYTYLPSQKNIIEPEEDMEPEYTYIPSQENIINKYENKPVENKYIPSQDNLLNENNPSQQINKYIPSQKPIQVNKIFDNSALAAALRRADNAEKKAINTLAGNFGNI